MSALSAAVLRIGASLDLDNVLAEVVVGARALSGTVVTVDASGRPGDLVITPGLTGPSVLGDLAIDRARRRVTIAGSPVRLTAIEYKILYALSLDAGGATTYDTLRRRVWGDRGGANPQAVRNAIRKLRRKIGDDARNPKYILSERGLGYRMPGLDDT